MINSRTNNEFRFVFDRVVSGDDAVATTLNSRPGCAGAVAANGGTAIAAGTPYASIFPGNIIPSQCFDPTAADLLGALVPLPNVGAQTFLSSPNARVRQDQFAVRLDHNQIGRASCRERVEADKV